MRGDLLENRDLVVGRVSPEIAGTISSAGISMRDNAIVFGIDRDSDFATERNLSSGDARENLARDLEGLIEVRVRVALENTPRKQTVFKGGQYVSVYTDEGWAYCTAGFAATRNGEMGMLTAGHCADPVELGFSKPLTRHYNTAQTSPGGATSELINSVSAGDFMNNYYGDVAFYTLDDPNDTFNRRFHVQRTKTKSVNGIRYRSQMMGHTVCHFGITSGKSCGEVTMINYDPGFSTCGPSGSCLPVYVKVEGPSLKACVGDSGGPWNQGRKAYGTHVGADTDVFFLCSESNTNYAFFYPVSETESRLGVDILE